MGLKLHYNEDRGAVTWRRSHKSEAAVSYIDYFITNNVNVSHFEIDPPVGSSDHLTLIGKCQDI